MGATHGLLGAAIGAHSPGLRTALGGAFASHLLADVVPHAHGPTLSPLLTLGALAVLVRIAGLRSLAALGFLAGVAPDLEHLPGDLGLVRAAVQALPVALGRAARGDDGRVLVAGGADASGVGRGHVGLAGAIAVCGTRYAGGGGVVIRRRPAESRCDSL